MLLARPLEPLGDLAGDALGDLAGDALGDPAGDAIGDSAGDALPWGSSSSPSRCPMLRATHRSSSDARYTLQLLVRAKGLLNPTTDELPDAHDADELLEPDADELLEPARSSSCRLRGMRSSGLRGMRSSRLRGMHSSRLR